MLFQKGFNTSKEVFGDDTVLEPIVLFTVKPECSFKRVSILLKMFLRVKECWNLFYKLYHIKSRLEWYDEVRTPFQKGFNAFYRGF